MKAVIYARVSSTLQDIENSIQAQTKACKDFADSKGMEVIEMYLDRGESGKISQRPEFLRMIADAKKRKFGTILIHKLDRFSRNRDDAVTYKALLKKHKVDLISVTEPLTDDLYGKLISGILEVVSEFYSLNLAKEVKKGHKQILERGYFPGGKLPLGYKIKKIEVDNKIHSLIEIDKVTAPVVKKIFEMSASGVFLKEVLEYLNQTLPPSRGAELWSFQTLYQILKNRVYAGEYSYGKGEIIKEDFYPAIISKELFERAQRKRSENWGKNKNNKFYLLSGFLFCSLCGEKLTGKNTSNYRYYLCNGKTRKNICPSCHISAAEIEKKIVEIVKKEFKKNIKFPSGKKKPDQKIKQLKMKQILLQKEKNNIINAITRGINPDLFKDKLEAILKEERIIEISLSEKKESKAPENTDKIIQISKLIGKLKNEELKEFLKLTVKVFVNPMEKQGFIEFLYINQGEKLCYNLY